ncbi:uncharacterized protein PG986_015123 [Apiospora aurea]|uniref:Uncharacterized protein n=1 Tax=Apiospora aurea TaxID=335848 RepID=A0ABR1PRN6_9PEZI
MQILGCGYAVCTIIQTKWGPALDDFEAMPEQNLYNYGLYFAEKTSSRSGLGGGTGATAAARTTEGESGDGDRTGAVVRFL